MPRQSLYQISARQILLLAFSSAIIAVGATALVYNFGFGNFGSAGGGSAVTFAEESPRVISDPALVDDEQNSIEVYRTMSPGVAFINTTQIRQDFWGNEQEGKGNGSGSVIDTAGHILTNYHVIEGADKLTVSFGGEKTYTASVVGGDADTDLAVIKLDTLPPNLTVIPFGDSDKLTVGQKVLAIGNPFGLDRTLTTGVISGLQRPIRARNGKPIDAAVQTDASINPGNSGGPLLDKYGRMIGINSQILSPAGGSVGVGFAVPVSTAKRVVPQLLQYGYVNRPRLGASLPSVAELKGRVSLPVESGLVVYQVVPGGSAERAGIRGVSSTGLGDIILSAEGQKLNDLDDLYRLLDKKEVGQTVNFEVYRGGRSVTVPIKLLGNSAANRPARRTVQE